MTGAKKAGATKKAPSRKRRAQPKPRAYAPGPPVLDEATLAHAVSALHTRDPDCIGVMLQAAGHP
ncbi:MAG: hypothetical protein KDJ25_18220, partial [Rhodoblastus sp.]|nr:hypothetical protein [Rhodoblastus sp.]